MELHALEEWRGGVMLLVQVIGGAMWRLLNRCLALRAGEIMESSYVIVIEARLGYLPIPFLLRGSVENVTRKS